MEGGKQPGTHQRQWWLCVAGVRRMVQLAAALRRFSMATGFHQLTVSADVAKVACTAWASCKGDSAGVVPAVRTAQLA